jgi:glycerate 2-kinase
MNPAQKLAPTVSNAGPQTVLIVPDKFKGTLTAQQAARAIARGWSQARPEDRLELLPMSDGGDGFGSILGAALGASVTITRGINAAGRPCRVPWWQHRHPPIAIVESAHAIGLAMLPPGQFHPFQLDTTGLGRLLNSIWRHDISTCLIGIGGSATNDGGFGMARALGWQFLDRNRQPIESWPDLVKLRTLLPPVERPSLDLIVATDVLNPLLGPQGASRIYGPQKGLRPQDQPAAEAALRQLAKVTRDHLGTDHASRPGAGAAGGLGFGLMAFLAARPKPGFEVFADYARLDQHLDQARLVITGEGAVDASTLMGKGVGQVAARCHHQGLPCVALGGIAKNRDDLEKHFAHVAALTDLTTPDQAMARPAHWLATLARHTAASIHSIHSIQPRSASN